MPTAEEIFRLGEQAAARAGNCSPRYVCPLCRQSFFTYDPDVLTQEHVPADALGGCVLLLTCRVCNSEGGHRLQASQVEREREEAFWAGQHGQPRNFELTTVHGVVSGEAVANNAGELRFTLHAHRMSPETLNALDGVVRVEGRVHRQGRGFDWRTSRVADLRDAYLWVFAQYGYSLIANDAYEWVRQAIREGETALHRWAINLDDPFTVAAQAQTGGAAILVTTTPAHALVVARGNRGCILPTPMNPDPYSAFGDRATIAFYSRAIGVPSAPRFLWDMRTRTPV